MPEAFDEILDEEGLIPADQLAELRKRSDGPSLRRLASHLFVLAAAVVLVVVFHGSWWVVPATVALAALLASVFAPFHECTHQTAFASPALNRWAAVGTGLLCGQTAAGYRGFHLDHHRYTQDPARDPEILHAPDTAGPWPTTARGWLHMITHGDILAGKVKLMASAWVRPAVYPDAAVGRRARTELRIAASLWGGLLIAGLLSVPGALAIVVAFALSHVFLGIWLQTEHTGRPFHGSILERTRTVGTPAWVRFFLWNMNYHAEHHAWPAIPWHALPRLHYLVRRHIDAAPGYLALHRDVFAAATLRRDPVSPVAAASATRDRCSRAEAAAEGADRGWRRRPSPPP